MNTYVCVCLGSFVLAVLITPVVIWLADRIGAIDRPGVRTVHERSIPRIGGVAIFLSTMSPIIFAVFLNDNIGSAFRAAPTQLVTLLSSATLVCAVGLVDDLKGLPARVKFSAELLLATVLYFVGVRISQVTLMDGWMLPLGGWSYIVTILWIVGITNAVNLSDGLDGLAAGICAIACSGLVLCAFYSGNVIMGVFMLALVGSLSGFLVFNFHPARIFMGDCGSLFLGFMIAASSVMGVVTSAALVGLALPALALGIPIFDTLCSMLRRFLERRSLFAPDRGHFHHRLLELGLSQRGAVLTIYLITLVAASLGLLMLASDDSIHSLFVFGGAWLLIVLVFRAAGILQVHDILIRLRHKRLLSRRERDERRIFEDSQLQFRQVRDASQWWKTVCQTARQMDFAWVSLKTHGADGETREELWRTSSPRSDPGGMVIIRVPLRSTAPDRTASLELATAKNGSLETISRRAMLFARLLDENEM